MAKTLLGITETLVGITEIILGITANLLGTMETPLGITLASGMSEGASYQQVNVTTGKDGVS